MTKNITITYDEFCYIKNGDYSSNRIAKIAAKYIPCRPDEIEDTTFKLFYKCSFSVTLNPIPFKQPEYYQSLPHIVKAMQYSYKNKRDCDEFTQNKIWTKDTTDSFGWGYETILDGQRLYDGNYIVQYEGSTSFTVMDEKEFNKLYKKQ